MNVSCGYQSNGHNLCSDKIFDLNVSHVIIHATYIGSTFNVLGCWFKSIALCIWQLLLSLETRESNNYAHSLLYVKESQISYAGMHFLNLP